MFSLILEEGQAIMFLPFLIGWGKALCTVTLVGVRTRGFSYALMEKRRLAVCLVKVLYNSPYFFLNAVVSKRLESTEVQRMMYFPALSSSVSLASISALMLSRMASACYLASCIKASHSFRLSIFATNSFWLIVVISFVYFVLRCSL